MKIIDRRMMACACYANRTEEKETASFIVLGLFLIEFITFF